MNEYQPGLTVVAVGVLIVVLGSALAGDNAVWFSVPGALVAVVGVVILLRGRNSPR